MIWHVFLPARVSLGELRRGAGPDPDLPVLLEGACTGAEDPTKQSACSGHRATCSTVGTLLVHPEPLVHFMPAEGLPFAVSSPVSSRPSGLTPSLSAVR